MSTISIKGLSKSEILAELYNQAKVQGLGFLKSEPDNMSKETAEKMMKNQPDGERFDYVQGRVMKIDLTGDMVDTRLYNRDNGEMSAENIINAIRQR